MTDTEVTWDNIDCIVCKPLERIPAFGQTVEFGAFAYPLKMQLPGIATLGDQVSADAITRLEVHSLLTTAETHRARMRLLKRMTPKK